MKKKLDFSIDVPNLLTEIGNNVGPSGTAITIPLRVLQSYLGKVASRAVELDDPELNILMLRMKLYEVDHHKIHSLVDEQEKRKNNV